MAQLSEDCFAFGGALLSYQRALDALKAEAQPLAKTQVLGLADLPGRILSAPLIARRNVPPFDNSAVDGYAYAKDAPQDLRVRPSAIVAGAQHPAPLQNAQAVRILTGAPVPEGADTIVMEEDAQISDGILTVPKGLKCGANLRPAGEDIRAGTILYPAGHRLSALDCARLAASGLETAEVYRPARVAILSSGDEIKSGQVLDANRWVLSAIFAGPAFETVYRGVVGDNLAETQAALRTLAADLILTSGGVSVGERDVLRLAFEAEGRLEFWRVGIKPGRPVAFGWLEGTPFFGLPGNPVACFVTAQFLALPFALACLGAEEAPSWLEVEMAVPYKKKPGRTEFIRVHINHQQQAQPYAVAGAGILSSLTQCDGLVRLDEDRIEIVPGMRVPYLPFKGILT